MRYRSNGWLCGVLSLLTLMLGAARTSLAADLVPPPPPVVEAPAVPSWTFTVIPYGWFVGLNGKQTVRGRTMKVNASFIDIVHDTLGEGGTLLGLMGDFEARKGPLSLYGDLVGMKLGVERSHVRTRSLLPGVTGTVGRSLSLDVGMAILEGGATYEVLRSGPLALDVLAGARYWYQSVDLSFDRAQTTNIGDLELRGARALAKSGSVNWIDPLVGARLRYTVAPGHELFVRGDIGGFGVGSKSSWQAIGGYGFDIGTYKGIAFSGIVGYRALYVDYARGEGRDRYRFDMLMHGPVIGISARF